MEWVSRAKCDRYHGGSTSNSILSEIKPTAGIGVVLLSVRSNIGPSMSVWYIYSKARAGHELCVCDLVSVFVLIRASNLSQKRYALYIGRLYCCCNS